jgi:hypothetical protein
LNDFRLLPVKKTSPMYFWRSFLIAFVAVMLLAGCVYVPPYYEDPITPPPWNYPVEPYPRRFDYYGRRPQPYTPRRRYYDERYSGDYRPDDTLPDHGSSDERQQAVPPSKVEAPIPPKGLEPRSDPKDIPVATRGSKPGRVKIPFPPYSELDVTGLLPGSLAKDPTSGKVFRLP